MASGRRFRKLETANDLKRVMTTYYAKLRYLRLGRPVAWITSGAPVEILRAMGVTVAYPENYGAMCGVSGAVPLCQESEHRGYSRDVCSYARSHLGSLYNPAIAPMGGLPRPTLLVACNNICGTVLKWYQAIQQETGAPLFVLDTPFVHDELTDHSVTYVRTQLDDLVGWVTEQTGRKLKPDKLTQTVALSNECVRLWTAIREACQARPSPLNAPDLFTNMAPIVVLRGTKDAVGFYRKLLAEVEARVDRGEGAILDERYRLIWDNIAIWPKLFRFFKPFIDAGACFVSDTYTGAWATPVDDTADPLDGLARTYASVLLNQSLQYRARDLVGLVERFQADGFVMHSNRSCKPYSLGQYDIRRLVTEATGAPGLIVEADMADSRAYADGPIGTRVAAFLETLEA
ncbi:MAG: 2-hydroxyacyl-CoA dehydratase family protein, partial [Chloroflexi bacterium]|nr:2-hydroxyacyl-CoA dehydratase family protein [Chloroflexota bacterium]